MKHQFDEKILRFKDGYDGELNRPPWCGARECGDEEFQEEQLPSDVLPFNIGKPAQPQGAPRRKER